MPSSLPLSLHIYFFLSLSLSFSSPLQALNHQTNILVPALLVTQTVPVIIHLCYLMCTICANIHLHTAVLLPVSEEDGRANGGIIIIHC